MVRVSSKHGVRFGIRHKTADNRHSEVHQVNILLEQKYLKLVQDRRFPCRVETEHEYSIFVVAEKDIEKGRVKRR